MVVAQRHTASCKLVLQCGMCALGAMPRPNNNNNDTGVTLIIVLDCLVHHATLHVATMVLLVLDHVCSTN